MAHVEMKEGVEVCRTGDVSHGSRCLVQGRRVCMEYWGPHARHAQVVTVIDDELEHAVLDVHSGRVTILGYDVVRWDAAAPAAGWAYVAESIPCELPVEAFVHIFGERLPAHLKPRR